MFNIYSKKLKGSLFEVILLLIVPSTLARFPGYKNRNISHLKPFKVKEGIFGGRVISRLVSTIFFSVKLQIENS